jgi:hypothetical protein
MSPQQPSYQSLPTTDSSEELQRQQEAIHDRKIHQEHEYEKLKVQEDKGSHHVVGKNGKQQDKKESLWTVFSAVSVSAMPRYSLYTIGLTKTIYDD